MSMSKLPKRYIYKTVSFFFSILIALVSLTYIPANQAWAASISWVGGTDSNWSTAANWSGGQVPGSSDDVLIDVSATINLSSSTTIKSLTLGNSGASTIPILNFSYDALTNGALVISGGNLHIYSGGKITHTAGTTAVVGSISINVTSGDFVVDLGANIDADGKGYQYSSGLGEGTDSGGGNGGAGAGYGGSGGVGSISAATGGSPYGSIQNPQNAGSGGGDSKGGSGGGIILLNVSGSVTNNGAIKSNGSNGLAGGAGAGGGGGSGGTVNITCGTFAGTTGSVSVMGGNSEKGAWNGYGGGGSGGRIAVTYTGKTYSGTYVSKGGRSSTTGRDGGSGTIFTKEVGTNGNLLLDNTGTINTSSGKGITTISTTETFDNISITNSSTLGISSTVTITDTLSIATSSTLNVDANADITYDTINWASTGTITDNGGDLALFAEGTDLLVSSGRTYIAHTQKTFRNGDIYGTITTYSNSTEETYKVNLTFTGYLTIHSTGIIDENGKGYRYSSGPGEGIESGGGHSGGGAGYGGYGGLGGAVTALGGAPYGSAQNPQNAGSGGADSLGGSGGGIILLNISGTFTNDGIIRSNGTNGIGGGSGGGGGGGSGGTVNITCSTFAGTTGSISAIGGNGAKGVWTFGGGGSGGRIAINNSTNNFTGSYSVAGGTGANPGESGTISPNTISFVDIAHSNLTKDSATISTNLLANSVYRITDTGFVWGPDQNLSTAPQPQIQYKLNDNSDNSTITDSKNFLNASFIGTGGIDNYTSAHTTVGKLNSSIEFDGTQDYLDLPDGLANYTNGLTISMWVYPTILNPWARFIDFGNGAPSNNIMLSRRDNTNDLRFEVCRATACQGLTATNVIALNEWQYFTVTQNAAGSTKIYKNGIQVASGTVQTANNIVRTNNYIGKSAYPDPYYAGKIDDIKIYNSGLSAIDVTLLYNEGNGVEEYTTATQISKGAGSSGIFSSDLTGLTPSTQYFFKTYYVSNGNTVFSELQTFTTLSENTDPTALKENITGATDIYPGKTINITTRYSDEDGVDDLDKLYLQIKNPSGTDIEYYISSTGSNQTGQTPTSVSGAQYISSITYDTDFGSPTTNDVTVTWHITPNWTWTRSSDIQFAVKALDKKSAESEYDYTISRYTYENRLTFTGSIQVTDSNTNSIANGDWTGANLGLTFTGLKVVFLGTTDIYPLDSDFDVKLVNDESDEWYDNISSGENISISATTANNTNTDDTYRFSIINITEGGTDSSNSTFTLRTDKTAPVISSLASSTHPSQSSWYSNTSSTITWSSTDNQSGIYKVYKLFDQTETQVANSIQTNGTQTTSSGTHQASIANEGVWYFHLLVVDNVGLTTIQTYKIQIDLQNPLFSYFTSSTHPTQNAWYKDNIASFSWGSSDSGSGIETLWRLLNQSSTTTALEIQNSGTQSQATSTWTTPTLTNGIWYLHLLSKDFSGKTVYQKYMLLIDATTPDIVGVTGSNNGIWQNTNSGPVISWTDPNSPSDDTFFITNDDSIPSSSNFTYSLQTNSYDLPNQKEGETTIKVRAMNKAGTYSDTKSFVIRYDTTPPANVSNLAVTTSNNSVTLSWKNPTSSDFSKSIIMRSESHLPTSISDGAKIYEGTLTTYADLNRNQNTLYYYTVFAFDNLGNQSSGAATQATTTTVTTTQSIVAPQITENTKVIASQQLPEEQKLNVTSKQQQTSTTSSGEIHLYTQQTMTIEVPASTISSNTTDTQKVLLVLDNQTYLMKYNPESDSYKTTFTTPSVKGVYTTTIQTVSKDNTSELAITMSLKVDPYGYVFSNLFGNELRITNASVSLYTKINEKEVLWEASDGTLNPQITDETGEYQFFVTPGEYKLVIQATGYTTTETEWFTVEGNIIEKNIRLQRSPYLYIGIFGILSVGGLGTALVLKKRKK